MPASLLNIVAQKILATVDDSLLGDVVVEMDWDLAESIWQEWNGGTEGAQRRTEIERIAQTGFQEMESTVDAVLSGRSASVSPEIIKQASAYLCLVPSAVRRCLRRPDDPGGIRFPARASFTGALDLLAFLPAGSARFMPGDRPGDVGDFELVDLLGTDAFGESWKAVSPHSNDAPPIMLRFCTNRAAMGRLLERRGDSPVLIFDRLIAESGHEGILELKRIHLNSNPPCLEYEFFEGASATSLIQSFENEKLLPDTITVANLMLRIAEPIGFLHSRNPPIIHRQLSADKFLLRQTDDGDFRVKLLDTGLAGILPPAERDAPQRLNPAATSEDVFWPAITVLQETEPNLYLSPAALRAEPPEPRDDVYALGVLWYQLLTRNLLSGRPGGSQWRKRLAKNGLPEPLLELLESCFEDDPDDRPKDAGELAAELNRYILKSASLAADDITSDVSVAAPAPTATASSPRQRSRRADVWDLFDSLEKETPELTKSVTNSIGMKLVLIPAGSFYMGTAREETGSRENEFPRHEVALTSPLYVAVSPVTQQEYLELMGHNPSRFQKDNGGGPDHPAENVTWEQAVQFCKKLSGLPDEKRAGRIYRLPTEAEWEYACRAGTETPFCFGESLSSKQANFDGRFPFGKTAKGAIIGTTTPVGSYRPNNFGLNDLHGNVWEWCADWLNGNYFCKSPRRDPSGPETGEFRVLRGGSWKNHAVTCRAGYRNGLAPNLKDSATGFRVVLSVGI